MTLDRNRMSAQPAPSIPFKSIALAIAALFVLILLIWMAFNFIGKNNVDTWQVKQSAFGEITIIDEPGYYMKPFATVWTYPRSIQKFYDNDEKQKEAINVTFNDGGTAEISSMVRIALPTDAEQRLSLHRTFGNAKDCDNITDAVWAHLVNVLKNSAPLMSASENQAGRKAEFSQVVEDQLREGLLRMSVKTTTSKDETDKDGNVITVYETEIMLVDGVSQRAQTSPLKDYGIVVTQFSLTGTEYDAQTLTQFSAKKESFLAAEKSKAQREQEVQQRLMTIERGLREKAEVEADANKEKAIATIEAQKKVEVAAKTKEEAETKANQMLSVAKIEKEQALTRANQLLEVATINAKAAEQDALGIKTLAAAQAEKIKLGGAITEKERTLAEIAKDRDVQIAQHLANIHTPTIVMNGGSGAGSGSDWQSNLMNLVMLRMAGINIEPASKVIGNQPGGN